MFKFLVVLLLCIIAAKVYSADIDVVTVNIPLSGESFVYYNFDGHRDIITLPFNLPLWHWSK